MNVVAKNLVLTNNLWIMKKIILTLFICLSCIIVANARLYPHVVDTLLKRVVNGLEVIPVRTTYYDSGEIYWDLRVSDFEKCFQRFESKCPGEINYKLNSDEVNQAIYDWQDKLWEIYPPEIKALKDFDLVLFIDKNGRVFAVEFSMPDFHVLDSNNDFDRPEYTTIWLRKVGYDIFGTFNPLNLPREEFRRLIEEEEARMKSQQKEQ